MHLHKLSLANFKNYDNAELVFSPKINCIVGNNGVGKTNILDAIHYLSLTKSFFNNIDSANIKHGEEYFIIQGEFDTDNKTDNILCSFHKQKQKVLKRNGKEYQKLSDHVGKFPVVMISPADSALILEGSDERRKFLNKIISQYDPGYLDSVLKYNKALQQRNKLLKDFGYSGKFDKDMLSIWDAQLTRYGETIFRERKMLVEELTAVFEEYYSFISGNRETVFFGYNSHHLQGNFTEVLENALVKDRVLEYTTVGIHKDDLVLEMKDYPVRSLGSQGQQKSFLVALKLAKFDYIKRKSGLTPILLLDDIFDKFDSDRVEKIIRLVGNHRFGQIFITDTHKDRMKEILGRLDIDHKLFEIGDSAISEIHD
ncbi:MAG: DNA replication/repair protein RecF [Bacteroidales bacterium]